MKELHAQRVPKPSSTQSSQTLRGGQPHTSNLRVRGRPGAIRSDLINYGQVPSTSRLKLDAIHLALTHIRESFSQICTQNRPTIFMDSTEALTRLTKTPRGGPLCHRIKSLCSELLDEDIEVPSDEVPGHAGGVSNDVRPLMRWRAHTMMTAPIRGRLSLWHHLTETL